jgi:hypothetical protein
VVRPAYGYRHQLARVALLEANPWCEHCGAPANVADHQPPLSLHEHVEASGCCVLVPSCTPCSRRQGGVLAQFRRAASTVPMMFEEPEGIPADDPVWGVPWLDDLREVPEDSVWPRYATAPHPGATGSYGSEVERSARRRGGVALRWWQRLFARLLLQHDDAGELVFLSALLSTARQSGKTVGLREVGWWRLHSGELFGETQNVLHTARNFAPARNTLAPVLDSVDEELYATRRMTNLLQLTRLEDLSIWVAIALTAAYSRTSSLSIVDESWDVSVADVEEGIEPTLAEPASSQLLLASTAHRRATGLMLGRRSVLLGSLREPTTSMILEWSAPRVADIADPATWRMASPHWSIRRERRVADALERAQRGESDDPRGPDPIESFRNQWLNQWPLPSAARDRTGEVFLSVEEWAERVTSSKVYVDYVMAVEVAAGETTFGVVGAGITADGTIVLSAETFGTRPALFEALQASMVGVSTVLVGANMYHWPQIQELQATVVSRGGTETLLALPLLRLGVREGDVLHIPDEQLDAQVEELRVRSTTGNRLGISSKSRNDLVRCAAWAVHYLRTAVTPGVH